MKCIIHIMVVCSTAGGNDEQRAREGNDGRVDKGGQDGISCLVGDISSDYCLHT